MLQIDTRSTLYSVVAEHSNITVYVVSDIRSIVSFQFSPTSSSGIPNGYTTAWHYASNRSPQTQRNVFNSFFSIKNLQQPSILCQTVLSLREFCRGEMEIRFVQFCNLASVLIRAKICDTLETGNCDEDFHGLICS